LASPHTPIVPSKDWKGKSSIGKYGDFVMETDWAVGEVMKSIDEAGVAANTIIIFTSDNGCSKAADIKSMEKKGHFPSGDLRGSKSDIFDGGHRVPFIVRWPEQVKAGSRSTQTICQADFMATCAEMVGGELPENAGEDSVSILPALLGTDKAPIHEMVVHHSVNGSFAIRKGKWKLLLCASSGGWTAPAPGSDEARALPDNQLYDMSTDIGETRNLQADYPEIVEQMTRDLDLLIANGRSTPGPKQKNDAPIKVRKPDDKKKPKK